MKERIEAALATGLLGETSPGEYTLCLRDIRTQSPADLSKVAKSIGLESVGGMRQSDQVLAIAKALDIEGITRIGEGCLEILDEGFGFLRASEHSYLPCP